MSALPPGVPGYWRNETSGVLTPVVEKYLRREWLTPTEVATMRAYLRQWINGAFFGPEIPLLRARVDAIRTHLDVKAWLRDALDVGIDPL
jgi:hypothetical protein